MDKRIIICILIILTIGILAAVFFYFFEIVQITRNEPPSREYFENNYLAMERWLNDAKIPVRNVNYFDHNYITENSIIIFNLNQLFYTMLNEDILKWISSGKNLVLCITSYDINYLNDNFVNFLSDMGISAGQTPDYYEYTSEDTPDYHWKYKFTIEDGKDYICYYDIHNNIRIVRIPLGKGMLTVTGIPYFMNNANIQKEINAILTWELLAEPLTGTAAAVADGSEERGLLVVKTTYNGQNAAKPLLGVLFQRGNLFPFLVSLFLLIIFGFWSVIPVFGKLNYEKQKNSRSIKERFTAEISFLKKYNGLYYYDNAIKKLRGTLNEERNKS